MFSSTYTADETGQSISPDCNRFRLRKLDKLFPQYRDIFTRECLSFIGVLQLHILMMHRDFNRVLCVPNIATTSFQRLICSPNYCRDGDLCNSLTE